MKLFAKTLLHALIGGFSAGVAGAAGGAGAKSLLLAGLASALTSVGSLMAQSPLKKE